MFRSVRLSNPDVIQNATIRTYFLKRGLSWEDEYRNLNDTLTQNGTVPLASSGLSETQKDGVGAWNETFPQNHDRDVQGNVYPYTCNRPMLNEFY